VDLGEYQRVSIQKLFAKSKQEKSIVAYATKKLFALQKEYEEESIINNKCPILGAGHFFKAAPVGGFRLPPNAEVSLRNYSFFPCLDAPRSDYRSLTGYSDLLAMYAKLDKEVVDHFLELPFHP